MFEELIKKLTSILQDIESESIRFHVPEIVSELKDIINSLEKSKCSNDMFCGMDKKWQ